MRFTRVNFPKYSCLLFLAIAGFFLTACEGPTIDTRPTANAAPNETRDQGAVHVRNDPLHAGDSIKIDFSGTPTQIAPVSTIIKEDGTIPLDLIGSVTAEGKTPGELEKTIQTNYVPKYYTHLVVTVTPDLRYFYVQGEVMMPGRLLYTSQITVTRAIAAAGDFNPYAWRGNVKIYRADGSRIETVNCKKALVNPKLDLPIYPGDKIVVKKRVW